MPDTSTIARTKHEKSGKATCNRQRVLRLVEAMPSATAVELHDYSRRVLGLNLTRHEISRRLPEIRKAGLVFNGEPRTCRVSGTKQMTWKAD